jgi:hypothetical protein
MPVWTGTTTYGGRIALGDDPHQDDEDGRGSLSRARALRTQKALAKAQAAKAQAAKTQEYRGFLIVPHPLGCQLKFKGGAFPKGFDKGQVDGRAYSTAELAKRAVDAEFDRALAAQQATDRFPYKSWNVTIFAKGTRSEKVEVYEPSRGVRKTFGSWEAAKRWIDETSVMRDAQIRPLKEQEQGPTPQELMDKLRKQCKFLLNEIKGSMDKQAFAELRDVQWPKNVPGKAFTPENVVDFAVQWARKGLGRQGATAEQMNTLEAEFRPKALAAAKEVFAKFSDARTSQVPTTGTEPDPGPEPTPNAYQPGDGGSTAPGAQAKKDNTLLYVGIGAAALLAFMMMK